MSKNIVVCYDGTGNEFGENSTNVVGVFNSLALDDEQTAFYGPGVGTINILPGVIGDKVGVAMSKAFGYGLRKNLEDGHEYLMSCYEPGDKVFLLGFSRGAYLARALAGMLHHFGILQPANKNLLPYVTKYYLSKRLDKAKGFKKMFCQDCPVQFIGVWDTVASLGQVFSKQVFVDEKLKESTLNGYQAVAINEKRRKFPAKLWDESKISREQHIEQVWFPGVHSDIGGWYDERQLSDIAFAWMLDKAESCGLRLKPGWNERLA